LAILAEAIRELKPGDHCLLLTPHRGESRNLIGASDDEAIHAWARPDRVVLAKAPVDLLTDGRRWQRNSRGNPRMAMGGTGDVLAGLAAGLMARGCSAFDAARIAVLWECFAADALWQQWGPCYDTMDVLARLPETLRQLLQPLGHWPPVNE
jgi:ADP-dependent NAD(P)H-hydrate dehydratase / NAD(P)H-hydrate epimerase